MYCYDVGIVDFFEGTFQVNEYYEKASLNREGEFFTKKDLQDFLTDAFTALAVRKSFWEQNWRSESDLRFLFIPTVTGDLPNKVLYIKQDNNGSTFVVSECPLSIPDWTELHNEDEKFCNKCWPSKVRMLVEKAIRPPIKKYKENVVLCPFHTEKTPSCIVKDDSYHCLSCEQAGTLGDLINKAKKEELSSAEKGILQMLLAKKYE